ncbi:hypothetical protein Rhopal_000081-T1 [Rhodotorula paludigena]|uniref:Serine/threonine-protein phosphatase 4 regulatory subunit 2 n=1 Tax=Rhodotorula paludigena TaxID=86838 RepID=A0AAV5G421_9BASI|nr:hypothetical protein Rhopal_000081-T1 [Rhodotorula paludigena]
MPSKPANGYAVPRPSLAANFEWQSTFDELLEQTASTNVVDADWPILKDMIKHKLAEAISNFLAMGPPWPLAPEEALQVRERAYDTLDSFGGPPFTIQRLCELALYPRRQYTSLPKYLRAVNRILSVTSERSAFTEDDDGGEQFASTSATTLDSSLGLVSQGVVLSPAHPPSLPIATRRPAPSPSPSASPRSSPQVVPLLSPIPWLRKRASSASSSNGDVESLALGTPPPRSPGGAAAAASPHLVSSASLPPVTPPGSATDAQISPPKALQSPATSTPTGGLVDEVDPGSGGGETVDPVALSSATTLAPGASDTDAEGERVEKPTSLRERFVRASSPRVEIPPEEDKSRETHGAAAAAENGGEGMQTDP